MQRPEAGDCLECWRSQEVVSVAEAMKAGGRCGTAGESIQHGNF